jgi:hypothetical protein
MSYNVFVLCIVGNYFQLLLSEFFLKVIFTECLILSYHIIIIIIVIVVVAVIIIIVVVVVAA